MFRTQANPFDDVIAKATDENLTSENWEFMMDVWEKVNNAGENGSKDVVAALIKRLAHRNANVQLYTLELANALSQNCGTKMHRELASRAFTDALLRLAGDRNTHATVKSKVLEKMEGWADMFKNDPSLGIMEQAYSRLKSTNPNLHAPSKPTKREITDVDRRKEEEELQMALAISLQEKSNAQAAKPTQASGSGGQAQRASSQPAAVPHTTAATVSRVRALYDFVPSESGELAFRKGDIIAVLESVYKDWWKGSLRGQTGIFPLNYVEKLSDPTQEELHKDAQMESEVFGQIKNVEKLLALLSTSNGNSSVQDNEEITTLYHSTLAIRPKLIELIGKYSQKKDDFVALNEKFIKARRDYESLLESSMSQTAAAHYGRPPTTTPYSYPPGDGYTGGADPGRYYSSPGPHHNPSASPPNQHSAYPPPQQQQPQYGGRRSSNQYYPQQPHEEHHAPPQGSSSAPFYVVGQAPPGPQISGAGRTSAPSPNEYPQQPPAHSPSNVSGGGQSHHHPHDGPSQPQELATSIYDTPIEPTHEASFSQPPPGRVSPVPSSAAYTPYQAYQQPHLQHQRPVSASGQQQGYDPSPITPSGPGPYPPLGNGSQSAGGYQGYPPPQQQGGAGRQGYEMFLPPGSRAQS